MNRETELIERLTELRRTVRRRLTIYGACAVLAGGVASFMTIVSLDWALKLPWLLRLVVAAFFFLGFAGASFHWIIRPLRAPLTLEEMAGRIERRFPELRDRLSSAVSFVRRPDAGSAPLVDEVIVRAVESIRSLPLTAVLTVRPVAARVVWLAVATLVLSIVLVAAPSWIGTGIARYVDPMSDVEWPRTVAINPITMGMTAAVGEPVEVRMSIERGLSTATRAVVHFRETDGTRSALTMRREEGGVFSATIEALTRDLDYWFEAGDDSTERRASRIRVVHRPTVVEAFVHVHPPSYAAGRPSSMHDLRDGGLSVVIGSTADVWIHASKPVEASSLFGEVGLRLDDGGLIPLVAGDANEVALHAVLPVERDVTFRVELRDRDGFANRGAETYELRAIPDGPPAVTVVEPQAVTEVTPGGTVPVSVRVADDFGVSRVWMEVQRLSGEWLISRELSVEPSPAGSAGVEVVAVHEWSLEPLKVSAGDALALVVHAVDNRRRTEEDPGQTGSSSLLRIKIISEAEFEARLRGEMAVIETRIRQLALDQSQLVRRTESLLDEVSGGEPLSVASRLDSSQAAAEQARIERPSRDLAQRLMQIAERMTRNNVGDVESRVSLEEHSHRLRVAAQGSMTGAAAALRETSERAQVVEQHELLTRSAEGQRAALEELQNTLRFVAQWGGFQGLMTRTNDLLERQESLRTRTGQTGRRTLGKSVESLSAEESSLLKRLRDEQEQIARDVEELLQRMTRERSTSDARDAAAVEAIEEALRAARANDLLSRLRQAVEAVQQNRTVGAMVEQKAATQAMRRMMSALRERRDRELAELRKQLTDAREHLAVILEDQTLLRDATRESSAMNAAPEALDPLEIEQGRLRTNTGVLADDFAVHDRLATNAPPLREAAVAMRDAEGQLNAKSPGSAMLAQERALDLLQEVHDSLDEQARAAENEAFRRTLAEMREQLEGLRDAEREIVAGIGELRAEVERLGRLDRAQAREAVRLSRSQGDVRSQVDEVLPELERVIVYRWALERVAGWMEEVRASLYERRVDEPVAETAERIVVEIEKLISALAETEALPIDTDFVESGSSGSAEGAAGSMTAVPAVAELLVLKTLQLDVNERTRSLAEALGDRDPTEAQLRRLRAVGEDQKEIKRLAELVTQRARQ